MDTNNIQYLLCSVNTGKIGQECLRSIFLNMVRYYSKLQDTQIHTSTCFPENQIIII